MKLPYYRVHLEAVLGNETILLTANASIFTAKLFDMSILRRRARVTAQATDEVFDPGNL